MYFLRPLRSAVDCVTLKTAQPTVFVISRTLFGNSDPESNSKKKEYSERRMLGYSATQIYDVVAEVDKYPEFVPWCRSARVNYRRPGLSRCQLEIGFPPLVERYTAVVTLARPSLVKSVCTEGRLFNHLVTLWRFGPGLADNPQTCTLDFSVGLLLLTGCIYRLLYLCTFLGGIRISIGPAFTLGTCILRRGSENNGTIFP